MKRPTLSICIIVGDAHVSCLARCLKSILDRPEGPACNELVIGWNGSNDVGFTKAICDAGVANPGEVVVAGDVLRTEVRFNERPTIPVLIHRYQWKADFADARNVNCTYASGEWVMYVDADDILVDDKHPAFADSMEQDPPMQAVDCFPVKGTLPEFFASLPPHINVVLAPYNYVNSDLGRPVIRKRRPRAVRWSEGHFVWASEVHEVFVSAFAREIPAWAPGLLLVHMPVQAEVERAERNLPILAAQVERLSNDGLAVPSTLLYSKAVNTMNERNFAVASAQFEEAARAPGGAEDKAYFTLLAARCSMEDGDFVRAGQLALSAIDHAPLRPEGYLVCSEASFRLMDLNKCVVWYEAAAGKKVPEAGPMADDRFERCLRPVSYVGVAYLRTGRYAKAIEVAEIALKEATLPAALRIKQEAEEGLKRQRIAEAGTELASRLLDAGYGSTASRVLDLLKPTSGELRGIRERVETARARDVEEIPAGTITRGWLGETGNGLTVPLDAFEDPEAAVPLALEPLPYGTKFRLAVTDPKGASPYTLANRMDGIDGERLLAALEPHGEVTDMSLVEEGDASRYLTAEVTKQTKAGPRVPDVTIFCPIFAEPWGPWRILKDGTGGSEESVVYLARELAARGLAVDVYAPLDLARHRGLHIEGGVRWRPLDSFNPLKRISGIVVAHRAPWAVRLFAVDPSRLYVWHQDADYMMGWSTAIATTVKHLWVSKWQRERLMRAVSVAVPAATTGLVDSFGAVIGNGIPQSALDVPFRERSPFSCAYISSPVRGLSNLLTLWPAVRASFPEATLRIYYGWETTRVFPGMAKVQQDAMRDIRKAEGVEYTGRVAQHTLEQDLVGQSIWSYPTAFPEGYCNAGIRAVAAGLVPVYRRVAAMPEVQFPSPYSVPEVAWDEGGSREYLEALLGALQAVKSGKITDAVRNGYRKWASERTWDRVATALLAEFQRRGMLEAA